MNLKGLQGNPWTLQSTLAIKLPVCRVTAVPHEHGVQRSQRFLVHPLQSFVADACVMVLTHAMVLTRVMVLTLMRWSRAAQGTVAVAALRQGAHVQALLHGGRQRPRGFRTITRRVMALQALLHSRPEPLHGLLPRDSSVALRIARAS